MLCLTNVNVNAPLSQFNGFCKPIVAEKACPVIYRFDISHTYTDNPNSTILSDVKCLFFVSAYLCIQVAGFDAIFDRHSSMLGHFFYLHIVKSTPCNQSCKILGFLFLIFWRSRHILRFIVFSYCSVNSNIKMTFSHFFKRDFIKSPFSYAKISFSSVAYLYSLSIVAVIDYLDERRHYFII